MPFTSTPIVILITSQHSVRNQHITKHLVGQWPTKRPQHHLAQQIVSAHMPRTGDARTAKANNAQGKPSYADGALGTACRKTKLCKLFGQGNCPKGTDCKFAHGEQELRMAPDLTCTQMCQEMLKFGECSRGASCHHAHRPEDLRPVSEVLPIPAVADALAAKWQKRAEAVLSRPTNTDAPNEVDTSEAREHDDGSPSTSSSGSGSESDVFVVETSFLDASAEERLFEGCRLFYVPASMPLAVRNTFFDVDNGEDSVRIGASRRTQSAAARLAPVQ